MLNSNTQTNVDKFLKTLEINLKTKSWLIDNICLLNDIYSIKTEIPIILTNMEKEIIASIILYIWKFPKVEITQQVESSQVILNLC